MSLLCRDGRLMNASITSAAYLTPGHEYTVCLCHGLMYSAGVAEDFSTFLIYLSPLFLFLYNVANTHVLVYTDQNVKLDSPFNTNVQGQPLVLQRYENPIHKCIDIKTWCQYKQLWYLHTSHIYLFATYLLCHKNGKLYFVIRSDVMTL